jgi:hypothetical protein
MDLESYMKDSSAVISAEDQFDAVVSLRGLQENEEKVNCQLWDDDACGCMEKRGAGCGYWTSSDAMGNARKNNDGSPKGRCRLSTSLRPIETSCFECINQKNCNSTEVWSRLGD